MAEPTSSSARHAIRAEVELINPLDRLESDTKSDVLAWIDSGAELCRLRKPACPDKHLVSYFALIDDRQVLLVDHINAGLWLPTGGHVEPGEHPRDTALREVTEELSIQGTFLVDGPVLLTSTTTVGRTAGHTDVSLWYALRGSMGWNLKFDQSEFRSVRWFPFDNVPQHATDPEMHRFLAKLQAVTA